MIADGIDQSWGYASPAECKRLGIRVVSMYLSRDPSKNVTAAKVRAYHAAGVAVLLNWEHEAGAPLKGAGQGRLDAADAVTQVRALVNAVGYAPRNQLAIPFSCDRDVTPSQYPAIDAYYGATRSTVHAAGFLNGVYGEADLVEHLHRAGLTDMEWQTYAWSGGRLSPDADFYQFSNGQTLGGASVDLDRVMHADQLGAWWPPGHALNTAVPTANEGLTMDAEVKARFDAIDKRLTALFQLDNDGDGKGEYTATVQAAVRQELRGVVASTRATQTIVASLATRVASLQAAVAKLSPTTVAVDVAKIADAVAARVRSITWGAK